MFRRLMVALCVAAPSAAALAQAGNPWGLAAMPNGCMVQATSPNGTMLSIWGFAGDAKLGFLLQNRGWNGVQDGARTELSLDVVGQQQRLVRATARENIDSDGPGYFFTVEPGQSEGSGFLKNFTTARGMTISRGDEAVDTLPLAGSQSAMSAFARCLSDNWQAPVARASGAESGQAEEEQAKAADTV